MIDFKRLYVEEGLTLFEIHKQHNITLDDVLTAAPSLTEEDFVAHRKVLKNRITELSKSGLSNSSISNITGVSFSIVRDILSDKQGGFSDVSLQD